MAPPSETSGGLARRGHSVVNDSHIPGVAGSYPVRTGNRIRPLIGGEHAFRRICEAAESAQESVWVTVAFLDPDLRLPDGRGHLFDVLDAAAQRGLDVRALFWRCPEALALGETAIFQGSPEDHALLRRRAARFRARWDRLDKLYCHHQKSWIIDAGTPNEAAFVGGINLERNSVTAHPFPPRANGHTQDVYCEVQGPAATDVHHNFVQRWNGASERSAETGAWPSTHAASDLAFPHAVSPERGDVVAQLTRTVRRGFYRDETATPAGKPFSIASGEHSVFNQYVAAIDAAREGVYLENQGFLSPEIIAAVERALERNVEVSLVVPATIQGLFLAIRNAPHLESHVEKILELADRPNFTIASLAVNRGAGRCEDVYVHTKSAIVDDVWATIGSTNFINRSFFGDTELNLSFWGTQPVSLFRKAILSLHHGASLHDLGLAPALRAFRDRALDNRDRKELGEPLDGFAHMLSAASWLGVP